VAFFIFFVRLCVTAISPSCTKGHEVTQRNKSFFYAVGDIKNMDEPNFSVKMPIFEF
jgi:hypothetical protein